MNIIRAVDGRVMPWKNGGGSTTEVAIGPAKASMEDFDWRISFAEVLTNGPFSKFHGIDRTLIVVRGSGLALTLAGELPAVLDNRSEPFRFSGDAPTSAMIKPGGITDLNIMTRRESFDHRVMTIKQPTPYKMTSSLAVIIALDGHVTVNAGHDIAHLYHRDAILLKQDDERKFQIVPTAKSRCYVILLRDIRTTSAERSIRMRI